MQIAGESINVLLYFYKKCFYNLSCKNFFICHYPVWNYLYVFFNNHVHYLLNNVILSVNHLIFIHSVRKRNAFVRPHLSPAPFVLNPIWQQFGTQAFILNNYYTGEDLKPHPFGVLCFKSLPIPHHWKIKMSHFNSSTVYTYPPN